MKLTAPRMTEEEKQLEALMKQYEAEEKNLVQTEVVVEEKQVYTVVGCWRLKLI